MSEIHAFICGFVRGFGRADKLAFWPVTIDQWWEETDHNRIPEIHGGTFSAATRHHSALASQWPGRWRHANSSRQS